MTKAPFAIAAPLVAVSTTSGHNGKCTRKSTGGNATKTDAAAQCTTRYLSVMDKRMQAYSFHVLYAFAPTHTNDKDISSAIDPVRLEESFYELLHTDYPFLLDSEIHEDAATGDLCMRTRQQQMGNNQEPTIDDDDDRADKKNKSRIYTLAPVVSTSTTRDVVISLDSSFVPQREPQALIAVQCTLLRDGGVAIGLNINHCVLDAASCFDFMAQWGQHYERIPQSQRPVICHDRTLLAPRGHAVQFKHPEYTLVPQQPRQTSSRKTQVALPTTTQRVFSLQRSDLRRLQASVAPHDATFVSSIDALTALLVVLITRARGHCMDMNVGTAVNGRRRLEPALPPHYAGNAVFTACSHFAASELRTSSSKYEAVPHAQLAAVAQRIRSSIQRQNSAFMRDTIEFLAFVQQQQQHDMRVEATTKFCFGTDILVSSWVGLNSLDASFGDMATLVSVSPVALPVCDGLVVLLDSKRSRLETAASLSDDTSSVDVLVYLESAAMVRFEHLWSNASAQICCSS